MERTALTADELLTHAGWMRALAKSLVGDPERADDVVQQSLVAAIEKPPRHARNLPAWLRRVVTNRARQVGRSETRRRRREHESARSEALPSTEELVEQAETQREVVSAILKLAEPQRTTVLLRFYRDHTPKEIAAMQGVPAATVRGRLKRALEELRGDLDRRHGGDRRAWGAALLPLGRGATSAGSGLALGVVLGVGWKVGAAAAGVALLAGLGWMLRPSATAPPGVPELVTAAAELEPALAPPQDLAAVEARAEITDERVAARELAPPTTPASYIGSVHDPAGEPVVGATLRFYPKDLGNWRDEEVLAEGRTGADGRFAIAAPAGFDTERYVLIEARADGHSSLSMDPVKPANEIEITLNWTTEVYGRVVDAETGQPLGGATVEAWATETTSAADGSYVLTGIPVAHRVQLTATVAGYVGLDEYRVLARREPTEHTISLHRGVPLTAVVFDAETGEPLSGVYVGRHALDDSPLSETDAQGRFTLSVLEGAELSIVLRKAGYAEFAWVWEVKDTTELAEPRIPMYAYGWIEGSVADEDGDPIENAHLYASNAAHPFDNRLTTAEQLELGIPGYAYHEVPDDAASAGSAGGFYSLPVIPDENPFELRGGSRDYVKVEAGPIHVTRPGQRVRVDLVLRRGGTIRGKLRYNGGPWSRGDIHFEEADGNHGGYSRISGDGSYLLENVPAGPVTLHVRDTYTRSTVLPDPVEVRVEVGQEYERDIEWTEELTTIRGFVYEASGAPVADERVGATWRDPDGEWRRFSGKTRADGSFEIEVVPDRTYDVSVLRRPAGDRVDDVPAGSADVELVLPEIGRVRFRLVDAQTGADVQPAEADLWGLGWRETGTEVFAYVRRPKRVDGAIELEVPLRAGPLHAGAVDLDLFLNEDGYHPVRVPALPVVASTATPDVHVIELARGVDCKLRLVGDEPFTRELQDGHLFFLLHDDQLDSLRGPFPSQGGSSNHRINGVNMWVGQPGLMYQMPEFDPNGFGLLKGLKPGRYTLRAYPDDYAFEPASFELPRDETTVEIRWRAR